MLGNELRAIGDGKLRMLLGDLDRTVTVGNQERFIGKDIDDARHEACGLGYRLERTVGEDRKFDAIDAAHLHAVAHVVHRFGHAERPGVEGEADPLIDLAKIGLSQKVVELGLAESGPGSISKLVQPSARIFDPMFSLIGIRVSHIHRLQAAPAQFFLDLHHGIHTPSLAGEIAQNSKDIGMFDPFENPRGQEETRRHAQQQAGRTRYANYGCNRFYARVWGVVCRSCGV